MGRKRRRKIRLGRVFFALLLLALFLGGIRNLGDRISDFTLDKLYEDYFTQGQTLSPDFEAHHLNSSHAILTNRRNHRILLDIGGDEKIYPASLTKIMTAIIAMEESSGLQEQVTMPNSIFQELYQANASLAGFLRGEVVTIEDLLYGTLLSSGAESSLALAIHISGSEHHFVAQMNRKAKALGMKNTHFTNVTGLHDDHHYTTLKDLSLLLEVGLENPAFREIFTAERYSIPPTNKHRDGFTIRNTMFERMDQKAFSHGQILGGKTGYTQEAGQCLASIAEKDGEEYLLITAGASGNHDTQPYHILDAFYIYENGIQ